MNTNEKTTSNDPNQDLSVIEIALFKYQCDEVQHHRTKIRYLFSCFITASAAILIFQQSDFFVQDKFSPRMLDWSILASSALVLTMIYYGLVHHCIKLLSKCATREYHTAILEKLRYHYISSIPYIQDYPQPVRSRNLSMISGPLGILFGVVIGWFAVLRFISRLSHLTRSILSSGEALDDMTISNICRADRITILTLMAWVIITVFGLVLLSIEFIRYHRLRKQLKGITYSQKI